MIYTLKAAALCGAVSIGATSAFADSVPHNPNALPPKPYPVQVTQCLADLVVVQSASGLYCDGKRIDAYRVVESIPEGYTGRVFVIGAAKAGYQDLGW